MVPKGGVGREWPQKSTTTISGVTEIFDIFIVAMVIIRSIQLPTQWTEHLKWVYVILFNLHLNRRDFLKTHFWEGKGINKVGVGYSPTDDKSPRQTGPCYLVEAELHTPSVTQTWHHPVSV